MFAHYCSHELSCGTCFRLFALHMWLGLGQAVTALIPLHLNPSVHLSILLKNAQVKPRRASLTNEISKHDAQCSIQPCGIVSIETCIGTIMIIIIIIYHLSS
jgi:hypothetical protein